MSDERFIRGSKVIIRTANGFEFARFQNVGTRGGYVVERIRDGLALVVSAVADPRDLPGVVVVDGMSLSARGY